LKASHAGAREISNRMANILLRLSNCTAEEARKRGTNKAKAEATRGFARRAAIGRHGQLARVAQML
jgi:hypothetical protein